MMQRLGMTAVSGFARVTLNMGGIGQGSCFTIQSGVFVSANNGFYVVVFGED
jgi:hypothetical protein